MIRFYQGQYEFTPKLAEELVTKLLAQADPANPPVIILQSDEGARNIKRRDQNNVILGGVMENYPIDTFVVVLNHYLNAGIAVDEGGK